MVAATLENEVASKKAPGRAEQLLNNIRETGEAVLQKAHIIDLSSHRDQPSVASNSNKMAQNPSMSSLASGNSAEKNQDRLSNNNSQTMASTSIPFGMASNTNSLSRGPQSHQSLQQQQQLQPNNALSSRSGMTANPTAASGLFNKIDDNNNNNRIYNGSPSSSYNKTETSEETREKWEAEVERTKKEKQWSAEIERIKRDREQRQAEEDEMARHPSRKRVPAPEKPAQPYPGTQAADVGCKCVIS
jgi:hypothetical protein